MLEEYVDQPNGGARLPGHRVPASGLVIAANTRLQQECL